MSQEVSSEALWELWQRMRAAHPVVQCITNYVSMDLMANTLLAAGASPAMVRMHEHLTTNAPTCPSP